MATNATVMFWWRTERVWNVNKAEIHLEICKTWKEKLGIENEFLTPSGNLGIGLVWDRRPVPIQHFGISVEILLKLTLTNYDFSDVLRCSLMFYTFFQIFSDIFRCSQVIFDILNILLGARRCSISSRFKYVPDVFRCSEMFTDVLWMLSQGWLKSTRNSYWNT